MWTLAVSYQTCSPSILVLECLIYSYFSGGEYVSPEVSSYKEKNYSKILPVEMCGCSLHSGGLSCVMTGLFHSV